MGAICQCIHHRLQEAGVFSILKTTLSGRRFTHVRLLVLKVSESQNFKPSYRWKGMLGSHHMKRCSAPRLQLTLTIKAQVEIASISTDLLVSYYYLFFFACSFPYLKQNKQSPKTIPYRGFSFPWNHETRRVLCNSGPFRHRDLFRVPANHSSPGRRRRLSTDGLFEHGNPLPLLRRQCPGKRCHVSNQ